MVSALSTFARAKREGRKLVMVSLYDAPTAAIACEAGVDALLVGDSLGNVILGHDNTIAVTMDDMARHTAAVVRGARASARPDVPVVADLPFGSYPDLLTATRNAVALMQAGAHAVKLEGEYSELVVGLRRQGIPVLGHLGYTPQSSLLYEGIVQGRTARGARTVADEAAALDAAGCFGIVLEALTAEVATAITGQIRGATIGIGAGAGCDGQVLVFHDLVGLSPGRLKFVKRYADTRELWSRAVREYVREVQDGGFPATEHAWNMTADEARRYGFQVDPETQSGPVKEAPKDGDSSVESSGETGSANAVNGHRKGAPV